MTDSSTGAEASSQDPQASLGLDLSSPQWALVDTLAGEQERVHIGRCRIVPALKLVVLHEGEATDCCDGATTVIVLDAVVSISIYRDRAALDAAVKKNGIHRISVKESNGGPEVR